MMLTICSFLIVIISSLYFSIFTRPATSCQENQTLNKCIPMLLAMTSSLTIGLLIGILLPNQLALATIFSILLSAVLAVFIGRKFGTNGLIEAQSSSLMGAMMGAMLGVMLSPDEVTLMVAAMDFLFLISVFFALLLTNGSLEKKRHLFKHKPASFYWFFLLNVCFLCSLVILQWLDMNTTPTETTPSEHVHHH